MQFTIVTIFPELFESVMSTSILGRAITDRHITVDYVNPRDFANDPHKMVDDTPYGGGQGMVMKVEPIVAALRSVGASVDSSGRDGVHAMLMGPRGRRFTQQVAEELAENYRHLVFVCGRYEGVDERVLEYVDEEVSLGDFVLTGGELAAATMVDSIARLVPEVLGHALSAVEESHSVPGYIEHPHYTRPEEFEGRKVPPVLLSGDHGKIAAWRAEHSNGTAGVAASGSSSTHTTHN